MKNFVYRKLDALLEMYSEQNHDLQNKFLYNLKGLLRYQAKQYRSVWTSINCMHNRNRRQ